VSRLALLAAGIATAVVAGSVDPGSLSAHMVQHAVFLGVAAPLLALTGPATLVLRLLPRTRRRALRRLSGLVHPLVTWPLFAVVLVALHLPFVLEALERRPAVHALGHAVLLAAGYLFWAPVVLRDPLPCRLSGPMRSLYLLAVMPVGEAIAVWYMVAGDPLAGALMSAGMLPIAVGFLAVTWSWLRAEEARAVRREAYAAR
jgi:putative membrane protein